MSGCRENFHMGFAQVQDYDTSLIYQLFFENTFFLITRVLLKISEFLLMETLG